VEEVPEEVIEQERKFIENRRKMRENLQR